MPENKSSLGNVFKSKLSIIIALIIGITFLLPVSPVIGGVDTVEEVPNGADLPEARGFVDGDFIVSWDEQTTENNALSPSVAVTPKTDNGYDGSIHVVWTELNENQNPILQEIHYSRSTDNGLTWTGETDDIIISETRKGGRALNYLDATNVSICIDSAGVIHVVWAELIEDPGNEFFFWEIMYSRSDDNGDSWTSEQTGDRRISQLEGGRLDGKYLSAPQIAVSFNTGKAEPNILHVIWAERDDKNEQEVYYSQSTNGGDFWTGLEVNEVISRPGGAWAYDPVITVSGNSHEFVHIAWNQRSGFGFDEIFYTISDDFGDTWPIDEWPISLEVDDGMTAYSPTMVGGRNEVYAVWSQGPMSKALEREIFYSASFDNGQSWMGTSEDFIISDPDGFPAMNPSVGVDDNMEVHVVWSELDNDSPLGSHEVHSSMTTKPDDPGSWSGIGKDIVLSWPDDAALADVNNVSLTMGQIDGKWRPLIVWDELNIRSGRADPNSEINTIPEKHTLSTSTVGSGSINKLPNKAEYDHNETVILTANPSAGWTFDHWSGDLSGSTNPDSIRMDDDKSVTVHFTQDQYTLTVSISPGGTGSVIKNPNQPTYTYNTAVQLTANPIAGYSFDHWSGGLTGSTNPDTVTITGNTFVTAVFVQSQYTLSTSTVGSGGIAKVPDLPTYTYNTVVQVTANPSGGWSFDHWSGDLSGSTNPDSITMDSSKSVTAHFTQDQYTLTVSVLPGGTGSVIKNPNQPTYTYNTAVQLTANPIAGYAFDHWSGALSGSTNPETIIMNGNKVVNAHFVQILYDIPIQAGWNLISLPITPLDTTVPGVLNDMLGDTSWTQLRYYDPLDTTDHWKTYATFKPANLNDLLNVDHKMGIWLYVPAASVGDGFIRVTGTIPSSTTINLKTGWNLVAYPATDDSSYDVDDLILDTGATLVEGQSGGAYDIDVLAGSYVLQRGEGYWIKVSSDTSWVVDW